MLTLTVEIKENNIGAWYLVLTNTITEKSFEVADIFELNEQMELITSLYPDLQPQVQWLETDHISNEHINEVRQQLLAFEAEDQT